MENNQSLDLMPTLQNYIGGLLTGKVLGFLGECTSQAGNPLSLRSYSLLFMVRESPALLGSEGLTNDTEGSASPKNLKHHPLRCTENTDSPSKEVVRVICA